LEKVNSLHHRQILKDSQTSEHLPSKITNGTGNDIILAKYPALDQCPAAVYLSQLKQSSRRPQKQALNLVASLLTNGAADCLTLNWAALRYQHTAAVRSRLLDRYAPATANRILSDLRGVLEKAWLLGQMSAEEYHRAARLSPVVGETLPAGRELLAEEIASLIENCLEDESLIGIRDAAIIAILFGAGLRREEITKLNLNDYNPEAQELLIRGKRSKQRIAYLGAGALAALMNWLDVRGQDPGPLFVPAKRGGTLRYGRSLSPQSIYYLLKVRAKRAGVKAFTPHDLRRTFVSRLLDAGVDIAIVAKMAGHSNIQTTARYDRRPEEAKQRAAKLLQIPYTEHLTRLKSVKDTRSLYRPIYCQKSAFTDTKLVRDANHYTGLIRHENPLQSTDENPARVLVLAVHLSQAPGYLCSGISGCIGYKYRPAAVHATHPA
jgi:site-specific recombinase XerD